MTSCKIILEMMKGQFNEHYLFSLFTYNAFWSEKLVDDEQEVWLAWTAKPEMTFGIAAWVEGFFFFLGSIDVDRFKNRCGFFWFRVTKVRTYRVSIGFWVCKIAIYRSEPTDVYLSRFKNSLGASGQAPSSI